MEFLTAMLSITTPVLTPWALWKLFADRKVKDIADRKVKDIADRPNKKAKRDGSSESC